MNPLMQAEEDFIQHHERWNKEDAPYRKTGESVGTALHSATDIPQASSTKIIQYPKPIAAYIPQFRVSA